MKDFNMCQEKVRDKVRRHKGTADLLWRLLRQLPAERRREMLERCFSAEQRRALERWVLANSRETSRSRPVSRRPRMSTPHEAKAAKRKARPAMQPSSALPGIVRYFRGKERTCYYAAQQHMGIVRMLSKTERCLEAAQRHGEVLRNVRRKVAGDFARFGEAIRESLAEAGNPQMGLRFVILIRIPWSRVSLTSPPYRLSQLEAGLQAWRRLEAARRRVLALAHGESWRGRASVLAEGLPPAWQQLREAYLAEMPESSAQRRAQARLRLAEADLQLRLQKELKAKVQAGRVPEKDSEQKARRLQAGRVPEKDSEQKARRLQDLLRRWSPH
ncbi:unnamed protein product [Effrenium voratum]|nr:unnamed protein product [Effrenium voratum]